MRNDNWSQFRDKEEERPLIFRMSCLWVDCQPHLEMRYTKEKMQQLWNMFRVGHLDSIMRSQCKAMEPRFQFSDLRFAHDNHMMQIDGEVSGSGFKAEGTVDRLEVESQWADIRKWKAYMDSDESLHKQFAAAVADFEADSAAQEVEHRQRFDDILMQAIESEADRRYTTAASRSSANAMEFMTSMTTQFAGNRPARPPESVLRLNVMNLATLGRSHSKALDDLKNTIREELTHHPENSCVVILPPTSCRWNGGPDITQASVDDAVGELEVALQDQELNALVCHVSLMFDLETMYSAVRDMHTKIYIAVSNKVVPGSGVGGSGPTLASRFAQSFLWLRRAVPELVPVWHRSHFTDWESKMRESAAQVPNSREERKMWLSGRGFHKTWMKYLFRSKSDKGWASSSMLCHIRDWTLHDDQLAFACMDFNMSADATVPMMAYSGSAFVKPGNINLVIADNVNGAIRDELRRLTTDVQMYNLPGWDNQAQKEGPGSVKAKPSLDESKLQVSRPRANGELALKQTFLTTIEVQITNKEAKGDMMEFIQKFNAKVNPSGVPWREDKRPADGSQGGSALKKGPGSEVPGSKVQEATALSEDELGKEADLEGATKIPGTDLYDMYFTGDGAFLVQGLQDGVISVDEPMCIIKGTMLDGNKAKSKMSDTNDWIAWKVDDMQCLLAVEATGLKKAYPGCPKPLQEFVDHLENEGHVNPGLIAHELSKDKKTKKWTVGPKETHVMEITAPSGAATRTKNNVAGLVSIMGMKESKRVHIIHRCVCPASAALP